MTAPTSTEPKKGLIREFRDFIVTGDLMSIAVAFIMAAITKDLITSFIDNIFNGFLALILGNDCTTDPDTGKQVCEAFSDSAWKTIQYGAFITQVVTFVATAFVVFWMIKAYRKVTKRGLAQDGPTTNDLLVEIRDELRAGRNR